MRFSGPSIVVSSDAHRRDRDIELVNRIESHIAAVVDVAADDMPDGDAEQEIQDRPAGFGRRLAVAA